MAQTFSCEKCRTKFTWKPEHSIRPTCPSCGNADFKIEFGSDENVVKEIDVPDIQDQIMERLGNIQKEFEKIFSLTHELLMNKYDKGS